MKAAGEQTVIAYFRTAEAAEDAAAKLRAMRAIRVSVDRVTPYPVGSSLHPADGILLAVDSSAGGHDAGAGELGRDIVLTAVVDAAIRERALRLVTHAGGNL